MADTWVSRGVDKDFDYATNVLYKGFELAIELTGNETYATWLQDQLSIVQDNGTIVTADETYNYTFYSLVSTFLNLSLCASCRTSARLAQEVIDTGRLTKPAG